MIKCKSEAKSDRIRDFKILPDCVWLVSKKVEARSGDNR